MPKRIGGNQIQKSDIARFNKLAKAGKPVQFLGPDKQWYSWEESDIWGKNIFGSDQEGEDHTFSLSQIDMVEESTKIKKSELQKMIKEEIAEASRAGDIAPQNKWWTNDPVELMRHVYWLKSQLPPSDKNLWNKNLNSLVAGLDQKFKAPGNEKAKFIKNGTR